RGTNSPGRKSWPGPSQGGRVCELRSPFEAEEYGEVVAPVQLPRTERVRDVRQVVVRREGEDLRRVLYQVAGRIGEQPLGPRDLRGGTQPQACLYPVHLVQRAAKPHERGVKGIQPLADPPGTVP